MADALFLYRSNYIQIDKITYIASSLLKNNLWQLGIKFNDQTSVTFPNMTAQEVTDFFSEAGITIENV